MDQIPTLRHSQSKFSHLGYTDHVSIQYRILIPMENTEITSALLWISSDVFTYCILPCPSSYLGTVVASIVTAFIAQATQYSDLPTDGIHLLYHEKTSFFFPNEFTHFISNKSCAKKKITAARNGVRKDSTATYLIFSNSLNNLSCCHA